MDTVTPFRNIWTPGTYVLINARNKSVADLSAQDHDTVIGYPLHGGPNQQWEFIPSGNGYAIRSMRHPGVDLYMSVEGEARVKAPVVATGHHTVWTVEQTGDGLRISWPNSSLVFELADTVSGLRLMLKTLVPGELQQLWRFIRCSQPQPQPAEAIESAGGVEVVVESARAASDPATTETVTASESDDFITTTRTTTTTISTTVTEVIRTPKPRLQR
ncbi:ricin B lectin domain-containing protein [Ganoderma leucocontextum]|nr:ricin B lectin domain-containing protein [Ganoderma leucocontextum]